MRIASALLVAVTTAATAHAAVTGTLIDESGAPIAGATVRAYAAEDSRTVRLRMLSAEPNLKDIGTTKSAENGTFRVDAKAPRLVLSFEASGKRNAFLETPDGQELNLLVMRAGAARLAKITDGSKAVENATVFAGPYVLRSDAEGRVELPDSMGTAANLTIVNREFTPFLTFVAREEIVMSNDYKLARGVAVRGRVVSAEGEPVAGAIVTVNGWPVALSTADGSFNVPHAPATWRTIVATQGARAGSVTRSKANSYDIKLRPAATVSGTAPAGARVNVGDADAETSVIADATGKYSISGLAPGKYNVLVMRRGSITAPEAITLAEGGRVTRSFATAAPVPIRGRVIDEEGKPVESTFVLLRSGGDRADLVRTAANGEFAVRRSDRRSPQLIVALKQGYAAGFAQVTDETKDVKLTLQRGFPLEVRVVDRRERPVESAWVLALRGGPGEGFGEVACAERVLSADCRVTSKSGVVSLRTVEDEHQVNVAGPSIARNTMRERLTAKSSPLTITVDAAVEVTGFVKFADGTPVANAMVGSRGTAFTRASDDGSFTLRNLSPGGFTLIASVPDRPNYSAEVEVTAPAHDVAITLPTPARIEGRVFERETGKAVTSFEVRVDAGPRSGASPATSVENENGMFSIDRVAAGTMSINVTAPGYTRGTLSNITLEEGKTVTGLEVPLDKGGQIHGRVTAGNQPLANVTVGIGERFGQTTVRTDESGEYVIDNLPPGEQLLFFAKEGFVRKRKSIEVTRGKEARLDVELDTGLELRGTVVDKSGKPVAGARVVAQSGGQGNGMFMGPGGGAPMSDASGNFKVAGLEEGRYRVTARKEGYTEASEDVMLPSSGALTLTVDTGGTITGRVSGLSDSELGQVRVWASGNKTNASTTAGRDGSFTLRGVSDGRVSVSAAVMSQRRDRRAGPQNVDVVSGSAPFVELNFSEGMTISGRVLRNGAPVNSGGVAFSTPGKSGRSGTIRNDGSYEVSGLEPGEYRVAVFSSGGTLFNGTYNVSGTSTYDINIEGGTVRGRVVDAATGNPVGDVNVSIVPSRDNPLNRMATSDSEGKFALDALPGGTYELRATSRQSYATKTASVTVGGQGAQDVELRLERAQPTTFRVTDMQTSSPIDATILVSDGAKIVARVPGRDDDGAVRVYVGPGNYKATVSSRGYVTAAVDFTVPGPEVRVALSSGGVLLLTAEKTTRVRLMGGARPMNSYVSPQGTRLEGIAPGTYTLEVFADDGKTVVKTLPVSMAAGQTVSMRVD